MAVKSEHERAGSMLSLSGEQLRQFPWWLLIILGAIVLMAFQILANPSYSSAFEAIIPGIEITLLSTLGGFAIALVIGLLAGLGRVANNLVIRNLAVAYIEFVRGVPILVLIFTLALVIVPLGARTFGFDITDISMTTRGVIALALIYGAFMAEIFRAGIESIPRGQMEAARSLGMTHVQAMRYIILPQAIRNILPALGNDFIAMLKDSSLLSVLAVREITQNARLYAGSTFRFQETYLVLTFLYLVMTIILSLLLQFYQKRISKDA